MPKEEKPAEEQKLVNFRVPVSLWRRLRALAVMEGRTVREVLLELIERHLKRKAGK